MSRIADDMEKYFEDKTLFKNVIVRDSKGDNVEVSWMEDEGDWTYENRDELDRRMLETWNYVFVKDGGYWEGYEGDETYVYTREYKPAESKSIRAEDPFITGLEIGKEECEDDKKKALAFRAGYEYGKSVVKYGDDEIDTDLPPFNDKYDPRVISDEMDTVEEVLDLDDITGLSPSHVDKAIVALTNICENLNAWSLEEDFKDDLVYVLQYANQAKRTLSNNIAESVHYVRNGYAKLLDVLDRWDSPEVQRIFKSVSMKANPYIIEEDGDSYLDPDLFLEDVEKMGSIQGNASSGRSDEELGYGKEANMRNGYVDWYLFLRAGEIEDAYDNESTSLDIPVDFDFGIRKPEGIDPSDYSGELDAIAQSLLNSYVDIDNGRQEPEMARIGVYSGITVSFKSQDEMFDPKTFAVAVNNSLTELLGKANAFHQKAYNLLQPKPKAE